MENKVHQVITEGPGQIEIVIKRESQIGQGPVLPEILKGRASYSWRCETGQPDIRIVEDVPEVIKMKRRPETRQIYDQTENQKQRQPQKPVPQV
jgi:hypothetical protein